MSTQARPLYDPANRVTHADGTIWYRCCDRRAPVPRAELLAFFPSLRASMAAALRANGADPEALWCHGCSTVLEDIRDGFEVGGPSFLTMVSSVAAFVPGIGTGVAAALGGAAALARGENITDAMVAGAKAAVPGSAAFEVALAAGESLGKGERIDQAALAAGHALARSQGGDLAAAGFDAIVAITHGSSLQEAGFAGLRYYARGNDLAEKGLDFADRAASAALEGRDVKTALVAQLGAEVQAAAPGVARSELEPVLARVVSDPKLRDMPSDALGWVMHVAEPVARAAQALVDAQGNVDGDALEKIAPRSGVAIAVDKYGAGVVSSRAVNASYEETRDSMKEDELTAALRISAPLLSYAQAKRDAGGTSSAIDKYGAGVVASTSTNQSYAATAAALRPSPPPSVVAAGGPLGGNHSTVAQDMLLLATVAGALGALYWWATSGKAA